MLLLLLTIVFLAGAQPAKLDIVRSGDNFHCIGGDACHRSNSVRAFECHRLCEGDHQWWCDFPRFDLQTVIGLVIVECNTTTLATGQCRVEYALHTVDSWVLFIRVFASAVARLLDIITFSTLRYWLSINARPNAVVNILSDTQPVQKGESFDFVLGFFLFLIGSFATLCLHRQITPAETAEKPKKQALFSPYIDEKFCVADNASVITTFLPDGLRVEMTDDHRAFIADIINHCVHEMSGRGEIVPIDLSFERTRVNDESFLEIRLNVFLPRKTSLGSHHLQHLHDRFRSEITTSVVHSTCNDTLKLCITASLPLKQGEPEATAVVNK